MELYILRHGIAEDGKPGQRDADRALTAEGKKKLRDVLKALARSVPPPDVILTSPYRRAKETAALAADALGCESELVETAALTPSSTPEKVWEEVRAFKNHERVLLSGHEPILSYFVSYLLDSPALTVDLKKGAMVRVDVEHAGAHPKAVLRWMTVPRLFQKSRSS